MKTTYLFKSLFLLLSFWANGQAQQPKHQILIKDVHVFNGKDEQLEKANILIEGRLITTISADPIPTDRSARTTITKGKI